MKKEKLVILDCNSLLNRAFYALPPMATSKGQPTGAVYGFTTMLLKIYDEIKPDYIAAAFDKTKITFRHKEYADYKAGRKKMPDELAAQFEPAKELLNAFNIGIFELEGYEADDIIGTISKKYESNDLEVIIYTGDRDALQLVSDYTKVVITKKGITETDVFDKELLIERYGLNPEGIIDLKGLMGDSSDNIPGVPGVGEKTALKLLHEYKTLENVFNNIDSIAGKKLKESLIQYKEQAFLSKRLASIERNVPIDVDLEKIKTEDYDAMRIKDIFSKLEFNSLINRINNMHGNKDINKDINKETSFNLKIKIYNGESDYIKRIKEEKIFNFIFLKSDKTIEGMVADDEYFVPENHIIDFKDIFESVHIAKNTYSAKLVYNYLSEKGIELNNLTFDAEIAAYILNPSESSYEIEKILKSYVGISFNNNLNDNKEIAALFIDNLNNIKENMLGEINKYGMSKLFYEVEMPLIKVLSNMELRGFKVNEQTLREIGFKLSEEIDKLTDEIYNIAGEEFNINSPKQLGVILFEKLNLPVVKKTKTGYSTDAEVLDELYDKNEIIEKILNYRQLVKLKSTYIDGLISCISEDEKIHSNFNQTVTATGRISSTEPNLQNIPIKMEQGRKIRKAFEPSSEEYVILSADYSQIELRVLAHISEDANLIDAFINNQDIHKRTASEVFDIPMEEVTAIQRSRAKAINFGIVYGLGDYSLSKDLKISRKEAKIYIDNYFKRYEGVRKYLDTAIEEGRKNGYVKTILNRIRYIPEINSNNKTLRAFGERLAMNTPIQGSAADIIKIAMVNVDRRLQNEGLKSRLLLQVHDELVIEVYKDELKYVSELVKNEMESAVKLSVPLIADVKWGNDWYEAK
ncbi:DNA polymerase I [Caloramator quimbayensis]|uniref:DNA polymerase I n=1 Tax=Caloramator quimbayensis TaxID=1147123 RepID=A0A1T4YF23_9CLOT|nr:DNA polymerase I [Caloramator quimbayensis]SKA99911.1 DNA polymerase I [Caloramator quimbayensis]